MNLQSALRALGSAGEELPEEALRWALDNWDVASGAFMQVLARCAKQLGEATDADVNIALFGLHLMAEKRETRAFPLVCALAQSPEGLPAILGDTMLWSGAAILISLFDGDAKGLRSIVGPPGSDGLLSVSAFDAIAYLTASGKIPREETHHFLRAIHDSHDDYLDVETLWDSWATTVAALGFDDLMPLVRAALSRQGLDPETVDISDIEDMLRLAQEDPLGLFEREGTAPIDDAIEMLRRIDREAAEAAEDEDGAFDDEDEPAGPGKPPAMAENPFRDVGRNDPCPCGSGKKFKKCCLAA